MNYFDSQRILTEPTAFDGRSDYKPFQDNGVAAGGLFSGAEVAKSAAQVEKWGGTAGLAFDPNYHQAGDTIDNLDLDGYEDLADGSALHAGPQGHVGRVPGRPDRPLNAAGIRIAVHEGRPQGRPSYFWDPGSPKACHRSTSMTALTHCRSRSG